MRKLKKEIWPYTINITIPVTQPIEKLLDLDKWCEESLGHRFKEWYSYHDRANARERIFAFKDEATLLVFKLTWGNYGTW